MGLEEKKQGRRFFNQLRPIRYDPKIFYISVKLNPKRWKKWGKNVPPWRFSTINTNFTPTYKYS